MSARRQLTGGILFATRLSPNRDPYSLIRSLAAADNDQLVKSMNSHLSRNATEIVFYHGGMIA
jgi:hypothetical protein